MVLKNKLFLLFALVLMISLVNSAEQSESFFGNVIQSESFNLTQTCNSATFITIGAVQYPNKSLLIINQNMTSIGGGTYVYEFSDTNSLGIYSVYGISDGCDGSFLYRFRSTINGEEFTTLSAIIQIFIILFFIGLMLGFYILNKQIDFDKWNKKIIQKYQYRNSPKAILSSMIFVFVKESFMVYLFLLFPIVVIMIQLINTFNLESLVVLNNIFLVLYGAGFLIASVLMLGKLQEFIMNRVDETSSFNWGVDR